MIGHRAFCRRPRPSSIAVKLGGTLGDRGALHSVLSGRGYTPSMWSTIRAMLVWLIVLAMPVQGFAAAGMLHCAVGQGTAAGVAASTAAHTAVRSVHPHAGAGAHARQDADAGAHTRHLAAASMGQMHDAATHASGSQADGSVSPAHGCSACAACCAVLALPGSIRLTVEPAGRLFGPPGLPDAAPSFVPPGLERPPRVRSA